MIEDNTIWKIITGLIGTLLGVIWIDTKSDIKENKARTQKLEETRYTKEETKELIVLHVDPIYRDMSEMKQDIKEIKAYLINRGTEDGKN